MSSLIVCLSFKRGHVKYETRTFINMLLKILPYENYMYYSEPCFFQMILYDVIFISKSTILQEIK